MIAPASTFGLQPWAAKLMLIAITIIAAILVDALVRWAIPKLVARVPQGREAGRSRQTASALAVTVLRYVVLITAVIIIVVIIAGGGAASVLGGSAFLAIILGFALQRLLADMLAGFFILFEGQYGVGDVIHLQPSGLSGVVTEIGVRTTILRDANGDQCYVPNGQITAVRRFPSARSVLSVTLLTTDPEQAEAALAQLGDLAGSDSGAVSGTAEASRRDIGSGVTAVHARVAAASTQIGSAQELVAAVLKARLGELLVADPVVTTVEPREAERSEVVIEP